MKRILICLLLISIGLITGILLTNNVYRSYYSSNIISNTTTSNLVKSNSIAMMLETDIDSNEYYLSTDTSWPQTGYTFNESLSKCENGATLSWDSDNNQALMTGSSSDKCYIYFDVISTIDEVCDTGDNLSNCIQELYNETGEGTVGIYYHDGVGSYTNADLEAGDYSYRYSGASDEVLNFVCFGSDNCTDTDNLYRIIGIFKNDDGYYEVKLIKYDYCTSDMCGTTGDYYNSYSNSLNKTGFTTEYYIGSMDLETIGAYYWNYVNYDSSNTYNNDWSISQLNTINLNTYFIEYLEKDWSAIITDHTWSVGGNTTENISVSSNALIAYTNEITNPDSSQVTSTYNAKIGLLYVNDYYYSADPTYWSYPGYDSENSNDYRRGRFYNWLYIGLHEWTIVRRTDYSSATFFINSNGNIFATVNPVGYVNTGVMAIRPTFYLTTSVQYSSGSGTASDPIILVTE